MAQTGYTPIQLYYSSTTTNVPLAANLAAGELAINITDGKLFYKDNLGVVQTIANKNNTGTVTSVAMTVPSFLSVSGSPITSSGTLALSLSGTALPTTSGGTGLTSFTANGVVYASSTSALTTGSALTFDGTVLTLGTSAALPISGSKFSIGNDANSALRLAITNQNAGASALVGIDFQPAGGGWKIDVPSETTSFTPPMYFKAGAGTNVTFAYGGNVGIGTSSPAYKLDVRGVVAGGNGTIVGGISFSSRAEIGAISNHNLGLITNNVTQAILDTSGNLGLGVTPSAWNITALQVKNGSMYGAGSTEAGWYSNAYYNSGWKYIANGVAAGYVQNGNHQWYIAASGSANASLPGGTGTQAMTLDASGNLGIGTSSPAYKVDASGQIRAQESGTGSGDGGFVASTSGANGNAGVLFQTNSASRWNLTTSGTNGANLRIYNYALGSTVATFDSSGNLGIGLTPVANNGILQVAGHASVQALLEKATISATAATGTINFDALTQAVLYYTSNASANWTVNVRGNSGTSLDTIMQTGQSITLAFLVTQGSTAYYNSAFQIDGASVTPKWQGGTAPTAGNASGIDAYVYTIIKTASATFTVLASQTQFK